MTYRPRQGSTAELALIHLTGRGRMKSGDLADAIERRIGGRLPPPSGRRLYSAQLVAKARAELEAHTEADALEAQATALRGLTGGAKEE